jgi:hypothetical protein
MAHLEGQEHDSRREYVRIRGLHSISVERIAR